MQIDLFGYTADDTKYYFRAARCNVDDFTCTGDGCHSFGSKNNDCKADFTLSDASKYEKVCLEMKCKNSIFGTNCKADRINYNGYGPLKQTTGSCNDGSDCASGVCKAGECCTAKGLGDGCIDCFLSDGSCQTCRSGYTLSNNQCFLDAGKETGSCTFDNECRSGSCKGGSCCTTNGMSTGCTKCFFDGDCQACSSGYVLNTNSWTCDLATGASSETPSQSTSQASDDTASSTPSGAGFDTTKSCKCNCCKGDGCVTSLVASYEASRKFYCRDRGCYQRFSSVCPDQDDPFNPEAGSVSSTFDSSSLASPPPPDADAIRAKWQEVNDQYLSSSPALRSQKMPPMPPVTTQRSSASTLSKAMVALVSIFFAAFATF